MSDSEVLDLRNNSRPLAIWPHKLVSSSEYSHCFLPFWKSLNALFHIKPVSDLAHEKFSFKSTLKFPFKFLFARATIMNFFYFCSYSLCCAIPPNYLVALECHGLWGWGLSLLFVLGKQLLSYGYHFKQVTVIVITSNNNKNYNSNKCTCSFTIHQIVSRALHNNI